MPPFVLSFFFYDDRVLHICVYYLKSTLLPRAATEFKIEGGNFTNPPYQISPPPQKKIQGEIGQYTQMNNGGLDKSQGKILKILNVII